MDYKEKVFILPILTVERNCEGRIMFIELFKLDWPQDQLVSLLVACIHGRTNPDTYSHSDSNTCAYERHVAKSNT